jgi:hypothetical protein
MGKSKHFTALSSVCAYGPKQTLHLPLVLCVPIGLKQTPHRSHCFVCLWTKANTPPPPLLCVPMGQSKHSIALGALCAYGPKPTLHQPLVLCVPMGQFNHST